eukprot:GGOE01002900.1.p1 GENE.GGOE01002900.1~~GGOE01002900.1.p1  ORF type:complete len:171 (+),score=0.44 GGOE01002900.1:27-515(+)
MEPLELIKPVDTRWNSRVDAHQRILKLRPAISAVVALPNSDWDLEYAVKAVKPIAVATSHVEADSATVTHVREEMKQIQNHFWNLASDPCLAGFAKAALEKCDARWLKHFDNDAALLSSFLGPNEDQVEWDVTMRQKAMDLLLVHATGDQSILKEEAGQYIL